MSSAYPPHAQSHGDFATNASSVDDLVSGAAREADDIDEIIRMAEAGIKPPKKTEPAPVPAPAVEAEIIATPVPEVSSKPEGGEKKSKKDKPMKMIYSDNEISPEEKMALMPRYAFIPDGKTESSPANAPDMPAAATITVDA